ncbi:MAG: hypothetical protein RML40_04580 [Bacteroidota bacterium]|nr:hypothetical protein [Candidatus Kapabacteria bacterium]MDW8219786.1 hypothetical protein [Bacteroidota bacterium]
MAIVPYAIALVLAATSTLFVRAQRMPERFFFINPPVVQLSSSLQAELATTPLIWMPSAGFWTGFERYIISDNTHAWRHTVGAYAELARWRVKRNRSSSIYAMGTFEHIADPNNDISFNPRAVWWEEGIAYATELDTLSLLEKVAYPSLHIGYYHRCRHEIDNIFRGESRIMIYGSITAKYMLSLVGNHPQEYLDAGARFDIYTIRTDYRYPFWHLGTTPSYFDLVGSIGFNLYYQNVLPLQQLSWYTSARCIATAFAGNREFLARFAAINTIRLDYGATFGVSINGDVRCRIGIQYEYLSDTEVQPFPQAQHLLSIGFTFLSPRGL